MTTPRTIPTEEEIADRVSAVYENDEYDAEFRKALVRNTLTARDRQLLTAIEEAGRKEETNKFRHHPGQPDWTEGHLVGYEQGKHDLLTTIRRIINSEV